MDTSWLCSQLWPPTSQATLSRSVTLRIYSYLPLPINAPCWMEELFGLSLSRTKNFRFRLRSIAATVLLRTYNTHRSLISINPLFRIYLRKVLFTQTFICRYFGTKTGSCSAVEEVVSCCMLSGQIKTSVRVQATQSFHTS